MAACNTANRMGQKDRLLHHGREYRRPAEQLCDRHVGGLLALAHPSFTAQPGASPLRVWEGDECVIDVSSVVKIYSRNSLERENEGSERPK